MRLMASAIQAALVLAITLCVSLLAVPAWAHGGAHTASAATVAAQTVVHAGDPVPASQDMRSSGLAMKARGAGKKCCPNCDDGGMRPGCCTFGHCGSGAALLPTTKPQAALLVSDGGFFAMPTASALGITPDLPSPPPR
ncbi:hypothetical protein [Roseomonas mucosa]|nr:hypothetical protein NF552_24015 [Roseomonas mucosa]